MLAAMLIGIVQYLSNYTASTTAMQIAASIGYLCGMVFWFNFIQSEFDRWYWKLSDSELIGGKHENRRFPLSTIIRIVPRLPEQLHPLVALSKYTHPGLWKNLLVQRKLSLLLQFSDGHMLPLHLHGCAGGTNLMNELVTSCRNRVDSDYEYSPDETKILKNIDWNRIAKKKRPHNN